MAPPDEHLPDVNMNSSQENDWAVFDGLIDNLELVVNQLKGNDIQYKYVHITITNQNRWEDFDGR